MPAKNMAITNPDICHAAAITIEMSAIGKPKLGPARAPNPTELRSCPTPDSGWRCRTFGVVYQADCRKSKPTAPNSVFRPELGTINQRQTTPVTMKETAIGKRKRLRKMFSPRIL